MSPSTNHECGLLVSGFEHHPVIMTPWNPPYYEKLVEGAGLAWQDFDPKEIEGKTVTVRVRYDAQYNNNKITYLKPR